MTAKKIVPPSIADSATEPMPKRPLTPTVHTNRPSGEVCKGGPIQIPGMTREAEEVPLGRNVIYRDGTGKVVSTITVRRDREYEPKHIKAAQDAAVAFARAAQRKNTDTAE